MAGGIGLEEGRLRQQLRAEPAGGHPGLVDGLSVLAEPDARVVDDEPLKGPAE